MTRVALITGAAGGIGQAALAAFGEAGWHVAAVDRMPLGQASANVRNYLADVSRPEDVARLFDSVSADFGRLDSLVNNAARQVRKPILAMTVDEWDSLMASNLRAAFLTVRSAHDLLRRVQGSIVNVSSVHALATSHGVSAYAASKGGLVALTRAMAVEFAPDQIRVNAILPGAVDTAMLREGLAADEPQASSVEQRLAELAKRTVLGRVGRPDEIAYAIRFLADNSQSSFITGQILVVDGGATARLSTE